MILGQSCTSRADDVKSLVYVGAAGLGCVIGHIVSQHFKISALKRHNQANEDKICKLEERCATLESALVNVENNQQKGAERVERIQSGLQRLLGRLGKLPGLMSHADYEDYEAAFGG